MVSILSLIPAPSRSVLISERVMMGLIFTFLLMHLEVRHLSLSVFDFLEGLLYRHHTSYTFL